MSAEQNAQGEAFPTVTYRTEPKGAHIRALIISLPSLAMIALAQNGVISFGGDTEMNVTIIVTDRPDVDIVAALPEQASIHTIEADGSVTENRPGS